VLVEKMEFRLGQGSLPYLPLKEELLAPDQLQAIKPAKASLAPSIASGDLGASGHTAAQPVGMAG